nr:MAG TPA: TRANSCRIPTION FACTOR E2F-4 DP-2/DNA TERNARY, DP, WINGED-HELIX, DNA-BINDING DOMAIN.6A [Bacteriophage sp.]
MSTLTAYGYEITNVFQLMGMLENDITKSIA